MNKYIIAVKDPNGWDDGCPNWKEVFFGEIPEGAEYDTVESWVVISGFSAAKKFLAELNSTGDWVTEGEERRPSYSMSRI